MNYQIIQILNKIDLPELELSWKRFVEGFHSSEDKIKLASKLYKIVTILIQNLLDAISVKETEANQADLFWSIIKILYVVIEPFWIDLYYFLPPEIYNYS